MTTKRKANDLFKLEELALGLTGLLAAVSGWVVRTMHQSNEKSEARLSTLEKSLVNRPFLESQLAPIRSDLNLILSHLLEHRKTENKDVHK